MLFAEAAGRRGCWGLEGEFPHTGHSSHRRREVVPEDGEPLLPDKKANQILS